MNSEIIIQLVGYLIGPSGILIVLCKYLKKLSDNKIKEQKEFRQEMRDNIKELKIVNKGISVEIARLTEKAECLRKENEEIMKKVDIIDKKIDEYHKNK